MTSTPTPTVAVVVPTHDRRASVRRSLEAFSRQSYPADSLEIVVVADGCSDGTGQLSRERWPIRVRLLEQPRQGAAIARNRGADVTTADLLIFVDDDVEVGPGFVAAHVVAHSEGDPKRVVIGYLPPDVQDRNDFFAVMLRAWWEAMFDPMRDPGHRFAYSDLLSGNFSILRSFFEQSGGFDATFRCHEDYELGFRLVAAGARFAFAEDAAGWHHEHTDLKRSLQRKRDEGSADIALARRHPALVPVLPLCRSAEHLTRRGRLLRNLALTHPAAGDVVERRYRSMLPLLEGAHLRMRWRRLLDDLLLYWYWRGVGESIEGPRLEQLCLATGASDTIAYDLDLRQGLAAAIQEVDGATPSALCLRWGSVVIARVPPQPGAEPLRGRHLPALLRRFAVPFGEALARARARGGDPLSPQQQLSAPDTSAEEWSARGT